MISVFRKIYGLLKGRYKSEFFLLLLGVFVLGALELIGVGLIVPVISVMTNGSDDAVSRYAFLASLNISNQLLLLLVVAFFAVKNLYVGFVYRWLGRFSYQQVADVRKRLHELYVSTKYSESLLVHTSVKIKNIGENADRLARVVISSCIILLSEYILLLLLLIYTWVMLPFQFIAQIIVGGGVVVLLVMLVKKYIKGLGEKVNASYGSVIKFAKENLEGSRELQLYNAISAYTDKYNREVDINAENQAHFFGIQQVPKLLLEFSIVALLIAMVYSAPETGLILDDVLLFGVVLVRLYPAVGRVVSYTNAIHFGESVLDEISELLHAKPVDLRVLDTCEREHQGYECIFLNKVSYSYPSSNTKIFDDLSLEIKKGVTGIIGGSGAGKSTLLDLLMGISTPSAGLIAFCNSKGVTAMPSKRISYVAQKPHIFDGSIIENIALGVPSDEIDTNKVSAILSIVKLDELVSGMVNGLNEYIGEHAGLLSGGQAQRLAIARALYFEPEILILDEATSALDSKIEKSLMDWLAFESEIQFIVMSAHKMSSLKNANEIIVMKDGRVSCQGDWEQIKTSSVDYQESYLV